MASSWPFNSNYIVVGVIVTHIGRMYIIRHLQQINARAADPSDQFIAEPEFVNIEGAEESNPRNRFRQPM